MDVVTVVMAWLLLLAAVEWGRRGLAQLWTERATVTVPRRIESGERPQSSDEDRGPLVGWRSLVPGSAPNRFAAAGIALLAALAGWRLVGPLGIAIGFVAARVVPRILDKRRGARVTQDLERQLGDVAETTAMAVRSGFSIRQALEFAAEEATPPLSTVMNRFIQQQQVGTPFEEAILVFAKDLATPDASLFALVVTIHARSGGNLAAALDEVARTVRHRVAVRRELRALSAQGRISGSVLGALPLGFFLVLAATSHHDLAPIYRSPAGVAMIVVGLVMEGLAFVWIRRLLRVEA